MSLAGITRIEREHAAAMSMSEEKKPEGVLVTPYEWVFPGMGDAYCYKNCGWKLHYHGLIDDGSNAESVTGGWTTVCPKRRSFRTVGDLLRALDWACESVKAQEVTPMSDGSYEFEIADHGYHVHLALQETGPAAGQS